MTTPRRHDLAGPEGVRFEPADPCGTGVLVLAGSSGRIDVDRARVLAEAGCVAESIRWFGGSGQQPGPFEVPLEGFLARVDPLASICARIVLVGTSFGAEAALSAGARDARVDAVVGFAPTDVVWAGFDPTGRETSHWTWRGRPLPWVPLSEPRDVAPEDPPRYRPLYEHSRARAGDRVDAAAIPVERIPEVLLVAGGDDQVWPSPHQAEAIRDRRARSGLDTTVVADPEAGHRAVLPGEAEVVGAPAMRRGGTREADRRIGAAAWPALLRLLRG